MGTHGSHAYRVRRRLETLRRRADFLERRIATYRRDGSPDRDKAELGALRWAIGELDPDGSILGDD